MGVAPGAVFALPGACCHFVLYFARMHFHAGCASPAAALISPAEEHVIRRKTPEATIDCILHTQHQCTSRLLLTRSQLSLDRQKLIKDPRYTTLNLARSVRGERRANDWRSISKVVPHSGFQPGFTVSILQPLHGLPHSHVPNFTFAESASANKNCNSCAPLISPAYHRLHSSTWTLGNRLPRPVMSLTHQCSTLYPCQCTTHPTSPTDEGVHEMITLPTHDVKLFRLFMRRDTCQFTHVSTGELASDNVRMFGQFK